MNELLAVLGESKLLDPRIQRSSVFGCISDM